MNLKCECGKESVISKENLSEKIKELSPCNQCVDVQIIKRQILKEVINLNEINSDYMKCSSCGKRPMDIVMSHILKIMMEEEIAPENSRLSRNSPVPIPTIYETDYMPEFNGEESLIIIHPSFNKKTAERIVNEVKEVRGVLKGNPYETIGILQKDEEEKTYELLAGCDMRCEVVRTFIKNDTQSNEIIINKNQAKNYIEVAPTIEEKLEKLYDYLKENKKYQENPQEFIALDGMCGCGSLGISLLNYGFKKVIFNDISEESIKSTKLNLEANGFNNNYEILNSAFEDLDNKIKVDLCILDPYPQTDIEKIKEHAKEISDDILII